jgi:hypothetical protein
MVALEVVQAASLLDTAATVVLVDILALEEAETPQAMATVAQVQVAEVQVAEGIKHQQVVELEYKGKVLMVFQPVVQADLDLAELLLLLEHSLMVVLATDQATYKAVLYA